MAARITGHLPVDVATRRRLSVVYDVLDAINSPNFFLVVDPEETGPDAPSAAAMRHELLAWLGTLDPDAVVPPGADAYVGSPQLRWTNDRGWRLTFRAFPKHSLRGKPGVRTVGMYSHGRVRVVDHRGPLLEALRSKGSRYGKPDAPYVIAVMDDGEVPPDASFIADACYGSLVGVLDRKTGEVVEAAERALDGLWRDARGPQYTAVSAVITTWNLLPWDVARRYPRVWHNPYATHPLTSPLPFPSVRYMPDANRFAEEDARIPPDQLFALPADWPGLPGSS